MATQTTVVSRLSSPLGLAVDAAGNLYIAQSNTQQVLKETLAHGKYTQSTIGSEFIAPFDVAVDNKNDVYVADESGSKVLMETYADGKYAQTTVGGTVSYPAGVALDSKGNLYITETGNSRVLKVPATDLTCAKGDCEQVAAALATHLKSPSGVAVDSAGNVYIADEGNNRVVKVPVTDLTCAAAGCVTVGTGLGGPAAVAVDVNATVYIADTNHNRVLVVPAGNLGCSGGCEAIGEALSGPLGVAVDSSCNVYISNTNDNSVVEVEGSCATKAKGTPFISLTPGVITTVAGTGREGSIGDGGPAIKAELSEPVAVAVDASGNLYISDAEVMTVRKVSTEGIITTVAGIPNKLGYSGDGGPATKALLNTPDGIAVDSAGNYYIADPGNARVRRVSVNGIITTVAGDGSLGFSGDGGPATKAELRGPEGVAVDARGNLYIADSGNHRIRKVNTEGVISTVAGNGVTGFSGDGGPATAAELAYPGDINVDVAGNLYITDIYNLRVRKVDSAGTISTVAGNGTVAYTGNGGPAVDAGLDQPTHTVADVAGSLYIADSLNNVVRKVDASTDINLAAGDGFDAGTSQGGFSGDGGSATKAELDIPEGIALDASGNFYIADMVNLRIRKVSVGASSITFATPTVAGTTDTTDGPQTVTVSNAGNADLTAVAPGIKLSTNFAQVPGTGKPKDCTVTFSLAPGESCNISVEFKPVKGSSGKITGTLTLTDNNQNATNSTQSITLTGTVKPAGG